MNKEQEPERGLQREDLLDITAWLDIMWKGIHKFALFYLVGIVAASVFCVLLAEKNYQPEYTAYATFTVNTRTAVGYSQSGYDQTMAEQIGRTFPYLVKSGLLNTQIAEELGRKDVPGQLQVSVMEGTNLITMQAISFSGQMAYEILQSAIRNYPKIGVYIWGDTSLSLLDDSGIPEQPSNPFQCRRAAAAGASFAMLVCLLLSVLYAATRKTIRKEEDLKKILNITCLGVIPKARWKKRRSRREQKLLIDNPVIESNFSEAIRTVSVRLERKLTDREGKTMLVTSAIPGEGKSTVSANLAFSLARRGHSVLLVDADLRKPSIAEVFGIEAEGCGIYEVLTGVVPPEKAICSYKKTKLKLLPGNQTVRNTTNLWNRPETEAVLEEIKTMAEYVIFDTPPGALVADASVLVPHVEGVLLVVRQDYAGTDQILEGVEMISAQEAGIPVWCVLNHAEVGIKGYGNGYYIVKK